MAKIIRFRKKKREPMSVEDYLDSLYMVEQLVAEARPQRLESARSVLNEMRFVAMFNHKFREQTSEQLQDLIDELYAETQDE